LGHGNFLSWVSPEFLVLVFNVLSSSLGSSDKGLHDTLVVWVLVIILLSGLKVSKDSNNVVISSNIWEVERLSIHLFGHGLKWLLRGSLLGKGSPHSHGFIVVRHVKSLAEKHPLISHGIDLLVDFGILFILLLLLFLQVKIIKFFLGLLLLFLELSENFLSVFLLEFLLVSIGGISIRGMSKSKLSIFAWDVHIIVLSIEFAGLFLELGSNICNIRSLNILAGDRGSLVVFFLCGLVGDLLLSENLRNRLWDLWCLSKFNVNLLLLKGISLTLHVAGGIHDTEDTFVPLESSLLHKLFLGKVSSLKGSEMDLRLRLKFEHFVVDDLSSANVAEEAKNCK
jgi:hypothetical protein